MFLFPASVHMNGLGQVWEKLALASYTRFFTAGPLRAPLHVGTLVSFSKPPWEGAWSLCCVTVCEIGYELLKVPWPGSGEG